MREKKPRRMIGKIVLTFDYIRLDDDADARPLAPLRDELLASARTVLANHAWVGHAEIAVRRRPKGLVYEDEPGFPAEERQP